MNNEDEYKHSPKPHLKVDESNANVTKYIDEHQHDDDSNSVLSEPNSDSTVDQKPYGRGIYDIFPYLVWEKALSYLATTDKYHLCHVCRDFEIWLKPTMCTWIFDRIIPSVEGYLPPSDLRNCRTVCRTWATAVNEVIYNQIQAHPNNIHLLLPFRLELGRDHLKDYERFKQLAQDKDYLKSSFVGKFVKLFDAGDHSSGQNLQNHLPLVLPILQNAWHFQLHNYKSHLDCYKILKDCLPYLKNAKSLVVWNLFQHLTMTQIRQIKDYITENPLPNSVLPKLESVRLTSSYGYTYDDEKIDPIHQAILTTCSNQIRILKIPMVHMHHGMLGPLVNLKELYLLHVTGKRMENFAEIFKDTEKLSLKKLEIESDKEDIYFLIEQCFWPVPTEKIFGSLCHLPLEQLSIICPEDANWSINSGLDTIKDTDRLRFKTLTCLKIEDFSAMSFDILLCMPVLKELKIYSYIWQKCNCHDCRRRKHEFQRSQTGAVGHGDELDLRRYLHNGCMYESNVWEKMENLERFSVEIDHPGQCQMFNYSRAGYKKYAYWERTAVALPVDDGDTEWEDID